MMLVYVHVVFLVELNLCNLCCVVSLRMHALIWHYSSWCWFVRFDVVSFARYWLIHENGFYFYDRLLKFQLPRLVSTVMLSATLLELIFSLPRSSKILCPLPTTVMYAPNYVSCVFSSVISLFLSLFYNILLGTSAVM